jgi:hypothetical protein
MKANAKSKIQTMKAPAVVIGFGLVALGKVILGRLRVGYLKRASEEVSIDPAKEIVLRYAIWYYIYPLLGFVLSAMFGYGAWRGSPFPEAVIGYKILCMIALLGAFFLLYRQLTARVRILEKKLVYTEGGDRREILANEVVRVSLTGFAFIVGLNWQKTVKLPATFEHSEIILAFLRQAADAKNENQRQ